MLYDPKWETKADPVSLEGVIAWLETMPAKGCYPYMDCDGRCLYSQYLVARGYEASYGPFGKESEAFWERLHKDPFYCIAACGPWTFGGALKRARKALASES